MTVTGHQQRDISTQRLFITLGEINFKLFTKNTFWYISILYQILCMRNCVSDAVLWPSALISVRVRIRIHILTSMRIRIRGAKSMHMWIRIRIRILVRHSRHKK